MSRWQEGDKDGKQSFVVTLNNASGEENTIVAKSEIIAMSPALALKNISFSQNMIATRCIKGSNYNDIVL